MIPLGRRAILARVSQKVLESASYFYVAATIISEQWPVTQPYGWTLLPWVIVSILGVGYAFAVAEKITR